MTGRTNHVLGSNSKITVQHRTAVPVTPVSVSIFLSISTIYGAYHTLITAYVNKNDKIVSITGVFRTLSSIYDGAFLQK